LPLASIHTISMWCTYTSRAALMWAGEGDGEWQIALIYGKAFFPIKKIEFQLMWGESENSRSLPSGCYPYSKLLYMNGRNVIIFLPPHTHFPLFC
jgi:hypothetical protein